MSVDEVARVQVALNRGQLLYDYDRSAWHVTDAAMATLPEEAKRALKGYITVPEGNALRTTFFGGDKNARVRVYSAIWDGTKVTSVQTFPPEQKVPVTAQELSLIEAREIALQRAGELTRCSKQPFNPVVLPPEQPDGATLVYLLTPQTSSSSIPMGGHYRIDVKDGKVVGQRPFTKSCISLYTKDGAPKDKDGSSPEALVITHLLDPTPTEIHVFSVFAARLPLYVGVSNEATYVVEISGGQPRVRKVK